MRIKPITQGTWTKVEKGKYQHIDGATVSYNCNRFMWIVDATGDAYKALTWAQIMAEKAAKN